MKMSLLEVTNLSHAYGDKVLYEDASFALQRGEHMGVVGQNGAGKSTLLGLLTGEIVPDQGDIRWQAGIRIGHLDQYAKTDDGFTIEIYLNSAFSDLFELERRMNSLYERYASSLDERDLERAEHCRAQLETRGFYEAQTRVARVSEGLGLSALGMGRRLGELSGGQRAKVILAKLLLVQPDVLLLDEPTNFLDKEHVAWLSGYLGAFDGAFIVVSHDDAFLSRISTCILDVEGRALRKYHGRYGEYLKQKEHLREDHIRQYNAQQQYIKRTEEYIRRNIAGVNTRMAQGRRKQLERLERIAPPTYAELKPTFLFPEAPLSAQQVLLARSLSVGYAYPLLPRLNFTLQRGQKVAVTGFNGIGKTTLIRTLMGELAPLGGSVTFAPQVKAAYYAQELRWDDPERTPIQLLMERDARMTQKDARRRLAQCAIGADHAMQPVGTLSGGEQAKVKLCLLTLRPSNLLILDEPTNHLDAQAKQALSQAIERYCGCVLLVSHEEAFYRGWADRVLAVDKM